MTKLKIIYKNPDADRVKKAVLKISKLLKDNQFAFRGTTSLVLQKYVMQVQDIDIICDKKTALVCNKLLKEYLTDKVSYKQGKQYKSYFGKFVVDGILTEVYGEWMIKDRKNKWLGPFSATEDEIIYIDIKGKKVPVTKANLELKFFSILGRWNAYHKLLRQVKAREGSNQARLF